MIHLKERKKNKINKFLTKGGESKDSPKINATMFHHLLYIHHKVEIQQGRIYVT